MSYIVEIRKKGELPNSFFDDTHSEIELAFNAIKNKSGRYETTQEVVEKIFIPADEAINHMRKPSQDRPFLQLSAYLENPNIRQDVRIGFPYITHDCLKQARKIENHIPQILPTKIALNYGSRVYEEDIEEWIIHIFDRDMWVHSLGTLKGY